METALTRCFGVLKDQGRVFGYGIFIYQSGLTYVAQLTHEQKGVYGKNKYPIDGLGDTIEEALEDLLFRIGQLPELGVMGE